MHWCYHPLCCLFVGLAQMLWVLPLLHFFKNALVLPPLVLPARGSWPNALGAAPASLFKNALVLAPIVLLVRGAFPNALGRAPVSLLKKAMVLPPLVLLVRWACPNALGAPLHHFFQKCTGDTTPCAACSWGLPKCSGCCHCITFSKHALVHHARAACPLVLPKWSR